MRRTPAQQQLNQQVLLDGLRNLDSRGLAALLKDLARAHHGRRAREVGFSGSGQFVLQRGSLGCSLDGWET